MLLQRANKYRAEPSPYQALAMGQWVGACRHEYNHALERRQYEYRNYGFSLALRSAGKGIDGGRGFKKIARIRPHPCAAKRPARPRRGVQPLLQEAVRSPDTAKEVQERLLHAAGGGRRVQATQQTPRRHQASQDRLGWLPRIPTSRRRPPLGHLPPEGRRVVR